MPSVEFFASLVEHDYGPNVARIFRLRFKKPSLDITWADGITVVDGILGEVNKPVFPKLAPTNYRPPKGELKFLEK